MKRENFIPVPIIFSVLLSAVFVAVAAYATSTISTDISTGGTLTVTGIATSTFTGGIQTNLLDVASNFATSTAANGWNLSAGCFAINGTCISGGGGSGTVTSVAMTVPAGLTISGSPITTSGTLALTLTSGYAIPTTASATFWNNKWDLASTTIGIAYGGTNATSFTDKQLIAYDGSALISTSTIYADSIADIYLFNNADDTTTGQLTATNFVASSASVASTFLYASTTALTVNGLLDLNGGATTTSNNGFDVSAGCFSVNGACLTGGGSSGNGYVFLPSGSMIPDTASGLLQKDSDPNILDYLAFDGATDEYALFNFSLEDWDLGAIKAKFVWASSAAMTNGQTVIWGLNCYAVSDGDTADVAFSSGEVTAFGTYATSDETGPKQKITAATAAITVQGTPAVGDVVYCRVSRDADTDTATIDAWLMGVKIEYTKTTPAAW